MVISVQPFRFAVQATQATSAKEWRDTVRSVQDLGYATLFLADHYLGPGPAQREARWPPQHLAPIAALAASQVTRTTRPGVRTMASQKSTAREAAQASSKASSGAGTAQAGVSNRVTVLVATMPAW